MRFPYQSVFRTLGRGASSEAVVDSGLAHLQVEVRQNNQLLPTLRPA